jgi:hypothetical protein
MLIGDKRRLNRANFQYIQGTSDPARLKDKDEFAKQLARERTLNTGYWYKFGGKLFVQWAATHYRTNTGEELNWKEFYQEELYLIFGNPWVEKLTIQKPAQIGFSELLVCYAAFSTAFLRVPFGLGFEQQQKMYEMVGTRVQTAFDYITPVQNAGLERMDKIKRKDIDAKNLMQVGGVPLHFFFGSTAKPTKNDHPSKRQAPSSLSSFTAWIIAADEIELWDPRSISIIPKRQNASPLPTKPFRSGSTPGPEGGVVDNIIETSRYCFEWKIRCPHCDHEQYVDVYGNFFRPYELEEDGVTETVYIDPEGKPYDWFHMAGDDGDLEDKIDSAYVGCQECGKPFTPSVMRSGHFECRNTREKLKEFCDRITKKRQAVHHSVSIIISKLCSWTFTPGERIRFSLSTENHVDDLQQNYGKAVSIGGGKISLRAILNCIQIEKKNPIKGKPDLVVMGLDQGHAKNYIVVFGYYFPDRSKTDDQRWRQSTVKLLWYGAVAGTFDDLDSLIKKWEVDYIGMDSEPEVQLAGIFAQKRVPGKISKGQVYLCDEVILKGQDYRKVERTVQGKKIPMYDIHHSFSLDAVRDRIKARLLRLPDIKYHPDDKENFIYHLLTNDRGSDGRWTKPKGSADHYHHACGFAEAAAYISHFEKPKKLIVGLLEH